MGKPVTKSFNGIVQQMTKFTEDLCLRNNLTTKDCLLFPRDYILYLFVCLFYAQRPGRQLFRSFWDDFLGF